MFSLGNRYCFDHIGKIYYLASEHGESVNTKKVIISRSNIDLQIIDLAGKKNACFIFIFSLSLIDNQSSFFENMVGICFNHFVEINIMVC